MASKTSNIFQRIFIVMALIVYASALLIAYMNTFEVPGLFFSDNGYVDDKYYQEVSPDGIAFAIVWPIIYIWNGAGILYIAFSACLPAHKSPVNFQPTLIPTRFLVSHAIAFGATIGWLFAFDVEILECSLVMLIISAGALYVALGVSYKRVEDNIHQLSIKENRRMLWLVRILIQNGLSIPATWLTIATCLNLTDVIIYKGSFGLEDPIQRGNVSVEDASTIILSLLFSIIVSWFLIDNFVLVKYTQYTFTVFPVFILGLSGLVAKLQANDANRNLILASVILGFSVFAFIFRVCYFVYRSKSRKSEVTDKHSVIENQSAIVKL